MVANLQVGVAFQHEEMVNELVWLTYYCVMSLVLTDYLIHKATIALCQTKLNLANNFHWFGHITSSNLPQPSPQLDVREFDKNRYDV